MYINVIIVAFIITMTSLVGVLFFVGHKMSIFIEHHLGYLVSFSAGVFLFISYSLSVEVLSAEQFFGDGLFWILIGVSSFIIIFKLLPHFHHHHNESENQKCLHSKIDVRRILISDGIGNIGDGFLLVVSFTISNTVGLSIGLSIFIHEVVQGVSQFFVLKKAGLSTKKTLILNFLVANAIFIGVLGGAFLLDKFNKIQNQLLGISAGSFFVVVFYDLIPHSVRNSKNKIQYLKHTVWFLFGLFFMFFVSRTLTF